jgi:RNA-directed DNA polymerase
MSLTTPDKIRTLQRKLYLKAKAEPAFRFHQLYDKVWRADILAHAYALARANAGAPGVDGVTFAGIEATGLEEWLAGLGEELRQKTYRPQAVRRVTIPKPGGGERPLGIPTIRDRVVQTAMKLVVEPIFEADLDDSAYGYRPKRDAADAIKRVHGLLLRGYTDVVDADLSKYFDTIPHAQLMQSVARRIVDRQVLRLIQLWLKSPVEEREGNGKGRMSGGKANDCGTPQGGVISPLLANLYMNRFLKHWRATAKGEAFRAHIVNYADDFVILSRGHAVEALAWTKAVMMRLGLALNEAKTSVRNARQERFDFLGYTFGPHRYWKDGHWYLGASPSRRSVQRLKDKVGAILVPGNKGAWPDVRDQLNKLLRGWSNYFGHGTRLQAYRAADNHVYDRVRDFLVKRHKIKGRGSRRFPRELVFGKLGVRTLQRHT